MYYIWGLYWVGYRFICDLTLMLVVGIVILLYHVYNELHIN